MPEVVQEIGAIAGLASVLGLAVLSVLYISQARDVKRLREWAGRAPERAGEISAAPPVPGRVVAQPQAGQPAGAQQATPAPGQPVPQPAGAQGAAKPGQPVPQPAGAQVEGAAKPAQPVPQPAAAQGGAAKPGQPAAQPAAAQAQGGAAQPGQAAKAGAEAGDGAEPAESAAESADGAAREDEEKTVKVGQAPRPAMASAAGATAAAATQTKPAPAQETKPAQAGNDRPATPAGAPGGPTAPASGPGGPATPAGGRPAGAPPAVPSPQRAPVRPMLPPRPMPQQTAILRPPREPWYRRLLASPRYLVLVIAGILIVGGAAAFGVDQLASDDEGGTSTPSGGQAAPASGDGDRAEEGGKKKQRPAVVPANVTVAVLNGTTVPNLAQQISERVAQHGFDVGTVANSADQAQQRAESVVLFAPGHEREATAVSRRLSINQRQPIDPASQELAGDATVVVIAGADLAR